jgi:hypothetical protein
MGLEPKCKLQEWIFIGTRFCVNWLSKSCDLWAMFVTVIISVCPLDFKKGCFYIAMELSNASSLGNSKTVQKEDNLRNSSSSWNPVIFRSGRPNLSTHIVLQYFD